MSEPFAGDGQLTKPEIRNPKSQIEKKQLGGK
jgi:hypothetical protein